MQTMPLLNDSTEPAELVIPILPDIRKDPNEPYAGCTCDRWGHPCAHCDENKAQSRPAAVMPGSTETRRIEWNI
jgi:hypothetical protein